MRTFPPTLPRYPLTLILSFLLVLLDHPGHLIYYHRTIYVSSTVETRLSSSQSAFQSLTSVVRALRQLGELCELCLIFSSPGFRCFRSFPHTRIRGFHW